MIAGQLRMAKTLGSFAYNALCTELRKQRLNAGLSQAEVAAKLHVKQPFVAKVENGKRRLDVIEFVLDCDAVKFNLKRALPFVALFAQRHPRESSRGEVDPVYRHGKPHSKKSKKPYAK